MTTINTVTARSKLKHQREPHWHRISKGHYLGYRLMTPGKPGGWVARVSIPETGKKIYESFGDFSHLPDHARFDAACKAAQEWFEHLNRGGSHTEITLRGACERYLLHLRSNGRDNTAKDAEARFKRWIYGSKLAAMPVQKLTAGHFSDWRSELVQAPVTHQSTRLALPKPRSKGTVNRDMTALKAALNLALEDGYLTSDTPWKNKLKPFESADNRRNVYLDMCQRSRLIASAQPDLAPFLRALCMVPLRPGAMAALKVGSFDKRLNTLTIGEDKSGADRKITLPESVAALFNLQSKDKLPSAPMFTKAVGNAWNKDAWKGPFKDAARKADLPEETVTYALRHSAITDLLALHKLDTLTVAELSGTSLLMIEKHYGHLLRDHAATALDKLAL